VYLPPPDDASATQMLRDPWALNTHAAFDPLGAAIRSDGNGALITCSSVKGRDLAAEPMAARSTKRKHNETELLRSLRIVVDFVRL